MLNPTTQSGPSKEEVWIRRASEGDLESFNQLVLMYQDIAYNHAYSLLGDPALSDDAAQEGFIKAFQNINKFRGGSFRAWLLRIVTNSAYDILRQSRRHPEQPLMPEDDDGEEIESAAWLADPDASVQMAVEQNEEAARLYQILDQLPEAYRSVITLIDIHELDYAEAAQILNVPMGTIKSRLARARLQMQQKIRSNREYFERLGPAEARAGV